MDDYLYLVGVVIAMGITCIALFQLNNPEVVRYVLGWL